MKYAVKRTPKNHKEVNRVFNELEKTSRFTREHEYLHWSRKGNNIIYPTLQKGYTLVDIEKLKQFIKSKNKQSTDMKQEFKVGDEVIITSWHFNKELPVPQRATIVEIN